MLGDGTRRPHASRPRGLQSDTRGSVAVTLAVVLAVVLVVGAATIQAQPASPEVSSNDSPYEDVDLVRDGVRNILENDTSSSSLSSGITQPKGSSTDEVSGYFVNGARIDRNVFTNFTVFSGLPCYAQAAFVNMRPHEVRAEEYGDGSTGGQNTEWAKRGWEPLDLDIEETDLDVDNWRQWTASHWSAFATLVSRETEFDERAHECGENSFAPDSSDRALNDVDAISSTAVDRIFNESTVDSLTRDQISSLLESINNLGEQSGEITTIRPVDGGVVNGTHIQMGTIDNTMTVVEPVETSDTITQTAVNSPGPEWKRGNPVGSKTVVVDTVDQRNRPGENWTSVGIIKEVAPEYKTTEAKQAPGYQWERIGVARTATVTVDRNTAWDTSPPGSDWQTTGRAKTVVVGTDETWSTEQPGPQWDSTGEQRTVQIGVNTSWAQDAPGPQWERTEESRQVQTNYEIQWAQSSPGSKWTATGETRLKKVATETKWLDSRQGGLGGTDIAEWTATGNTRSVQVTETRWTQNLRQVKHGSWERAGKTRRVQTGTKTTWAYSSPGSDWSRTGQTRTTQTTQTTWDTSSPGSGWHKTGEDRKAQTGTTTATMWTASWPGYEWVKTGDSRVSETVIDETWAPTSPGEDWEKTGDTRQAGSPRHPVTLYEWERSITTTQYEWEREVPTYTTEYEYQKFTKTTKYEYERPEYSTEYLIANSFTETEYEYKRDIFNKQTQFRKPVYTTFYLWEKPVFTEETRYEREITDTKYEYERFKTKEVPVYEWRKKIGGDYTINRWKKLETKTVYKWSKEVDRTEWETTTREVKGRSFTNSNDPVTIIDETTDVRDAKLTLVTASLPNRSVARNGKMYSLEVSSTQDASNWHLRAYRDADDDVAVLDIDGSTYRIDEETFTLDFTNGTIAGTSADIKFARGVTAPFTVELINGNDVYGAYSLVGAGDLEGPPGGRTTADSVIYNVTLDVQYRDGETYYGDRMTVSPDYEALDEVTVPNSPPVPVAPTDKVVRPGETFTLTAGAIDPDEDTMSYTWNTPGTGEFQLADPSQKEVTFTAPDISADQREYTFRMEASDGEFTRSDTVTVTVVNDNEAPEVFGLQDANLAYYENTDLSASVYDPDSTRDDLTVQWSVQGASSDVLQGTSSLQTRFNSPRRPTEKTYTVTVTVEDEHGATNQTSAEITVGATPQTNNNGDGSGSRNDDGILWPKYKEASDYTENNECTTWRGGSRFTAEACTDSVKVTEAGTTMFIDENHDGEIWYEHNDVDLLIALVPDTSAYSKAGVHFTDAQVDHYVERAFSAYSDVEESMEEAAYEKGDEKYSPQNPDDEEEDNEWG